LEDSTSWRSDPEEIRRRIRAGEYTDPTVNLAPGFVQANLTLLHRSLALEFMIFCIRNPVACPLLDVLEPGIFEPPETPGADLRADLSSYRVYHNGALLERVTQLKNYWSDDMVPFLLDSSSTLDHLLAEANLRQSHLDQNTVPPLYETNIPCRPAGIFHGPLVVTMRPIPSHRLPDLAQIAGRLAPAQGVPIHIGSLAEIGIDDLDRPDWGTPLPLIGDEVPVFWASSVTPLAVVFASRPPLLIANAPGHRFVTDVATP